MNPEQLGVPEIRNTLFRTIWGSSRGSPIFGNPHSKELQAAPGACQLGRPGLR